MQDRKRWKVVSEGVTPSTMSSQGRSGHKHCNSGCPLLTEGISFLFWHEIDGLHDGTMAITTVRSRKRPTTTLTQTLSSSNGQNQSFFFVDPASSTREKRAHVMRHHIQAKRKQSLLATQTDRQSCYEPRVFPWMRKSSGHEVNPNPRPIRRAVTTVRTWGVLDRLKPK